MAELTYRGALNEALAMEMRRDDRVHVLGEDVAEGGPWGATAGLVEEFGPDRVRNTPISEAAICGIAVGAAQSGLRPVVEIMFIDFVTLALDQLVNGAAKTHFMSGGQLTVPMVLRTQGGAGRKPGGGRRGQAELQQPPRHGRRGRRSRALDGRQRTAAQATERRRAALRHRHVIRRHRQSTRLLAGRRSAQRSRGTSEAER